MPYGQILRRFVLSNIGETLQKVSANAGVSSDGTTHTMMGSMDFSSHRWEARLLELGLYLTIRLTALTWVAAI
jgi:hypothetical protein